MDQERRRHHTYTVVAPGVLRHIPSGAVGAQGDVQAWQKVHEQVDRVRRARVAAARNKRLSIAVMCGEPHFGPLTSPKTARVGCRCQGATIDQAMGVAHSASTSGIRVRQGAAKEGTDHSDAVDALGNTTRDRTPHPGKWRQPTKMETQCTKSLSQTQTHRSSRTCPFAIQT